MTDDNEINRVVKLFERLEYGDYIVVKYDSRGYFVLNLHEESWCNKEQVSKLEGEVIG